MTADRRRGLPAVNALVADLERTGLPGAARAVVVEAVRASLAAARAAGGHEPDGGWVADVQRRIISGGRRSLVRVVNATGVILHTNLGRAPLAATARAAIAEATGYCTLEFDVEEGGRGSRQTHARDLLREITGAEDALVVTNAAAALFLLLHALAEGGETMVSRGELVEIGDEFRIPEILEKSGSVLIEVGTTNRTRLRDYELALSPRTRSALKVHRSNFRISGFTSEASLAELIALLGRREIPVIHDVGSGLLVDLEPYGLRGEPRVQESVATGATVVFSGDKLMGGPQAGIIVGPSDVLSRAARHALFRALRPDKTIIAALEATLALYRDPAQALAEVPTLAMLVADAGTLKRRAQRLAKQLGKAALMPGSSSVGGGAFPEATLPTTLVALDVGSCEAFLEALRRHDPPVIARAHEGKVVLDVRTIADEEFEIVAEAVRAAG
jgi:L-seryl-tRNA(Ser) seleniumtransferase